MQPLPILELLEYDLWATRKLLESVVQLNQEQFAREFAGPLSSVRQQVVHLVSVRDRYRARLMKEPVPSVSSEDFVKAAELEAYFERVAEGMQLFAASISPEFLGEEIRHDTRRGVYVATVEQTLLHVVNHGTYHRGQVAALLKLHGVEPVDTDFLIWTGEK
jgi:uncharacterized damage-inducible protein DinB